MFDRFNRHFAFQFQGGPQEHWTPPWLGDVREWHGHGFRGWPPRFFWRMRRGRGPFGPGSHGEHWFGRGEGRRFFGRGDVKFALLRLLQERPMYGYEMIKALEEKSGGFYAPSAGSVYPTLQMLEEGGFVTSSQVEGKKVYSITEAGRTFLNERQKDNDEFADPAWGFGERRPFAEMQALRSEAMEVARLFAIAGRMSFNDSERLTRLRSIIERTRKDLSDMIYGSQSQSV